MSERRDALLEAALMCSRRGDMLVWPCGLFFHEMAENLEKLADSPLHYYPPGKPVIDQGQDSENSSPDISGTY